MASQVFIDALLGLANFAPGRCESPFRSWLFSIAHDVVINAGIKNGRRQTAPLKLAATIGDGQFNQANSVAIDGAGNIFVADTNNHRAQVFDVAGQFLFTWGDQGSGPGEFNYVTSVELDGAGNIYAADVENSRVQKFRLLPPLAPIETATT